MNLYPLLNASIAIQIHVLAVVPAALLGLFILFRQKGTKLHRMLGKIWVFLMVVTSISSFFIHSLNTFWGFSPIHILSILVLAGCARAIVAARSGNIPVHRKIMKQVYVGGILGAGLFSFMPGRIMSEIVFPEGFLSPEVIIATIFVVFFAIVGLILRSKYLLR